MKTRGVITYVFIFLLSLWFLISLLLHVRYSGTYFLEEIDQHALSQEQKEKKYFGQTYELSQHISSKVADRKRILFLSEDGKTFFLLRYLIYPRMLFWSEEERNPKSADAYDYLLVDLNTYKKKYKVHGQTSIVRSGNFILLQTQQ